MSLSTGSTSATLPNSLRTVLLRCVPQSRLLIAVWFQSPIYLFRRYDLACSFLVSQLRVSMFLRRHIQHVSDNSFKFLFIYWHIVLRYTCNFIRHSATRLMMVPVIAQSVRNVMTLAHVRQAGRNTCEISNRKKRAGWNMISVPFSIFKCG